MRCTHRVAYLLAIVFMVGGCSDQKVTDVSPPEAVDVQTQLDRIFERAGAEFNVPGPILKAIGYVETRWQMVKGGEEFPGQPPAFGIMALRGEQLARGASLANASVQKVKVDAEANIRAAAALLSSYASEAGIQNRQDLAAWAPAIARYSGIADPDAQDAYVHNDVYATLQRGADPTVTRAATLYALNARVFGARVNAFQLAPDYPSAVWRPSPNYNDRPAGDIGVPHMVIIHTCEGSYTSCWSWLTNSASGVSAHYVVKEDGAEISQLVYEAKRGWHIGATYDCSLNSSHECWRNGYSSNHFTIGVEHGGFASQTSWPVSQIDASAKLVCDISRDNSIPRDKYHILGHAQLQPANRTDPGANWPWTDYYNRINSYCSTSIIVDSNNNNNNTSVGKIEVSANWTSSNATPGYYGTGYWYATTQAISDPATFWFYLPAAATKTVDAWWTAGTNRSSTAPFIAYNASGTKLGTVYANQQANGGKWNQLGTWNFTAGWNKILLSRWTTAGYVVIADAVRIR